MAVTRRSAFANSADEGDDELVRISPRDPLSLSLGDLVSEAGLTTETLSPRRHLGKRAAVTSRITIGVDQRIELAWSFPQEYRDKGYRMLGFRRSGGFAPEDKRSDLAAHGQKVIDSRRPDYKQEHLPEGEYFYTFVLHRSTLLFSFTADLIQFSEVIPSAEHVIRRLRHHVEARKLLEELARLATGATDRRRRSSGKSDQSPRTLKERLEADYQEMYDADMALGEYLSEKRSAGKKEKDTEVAKDFEAFLDRFKERMIEKYGLG